MHEAEGSHSGIVATNPTNIPRRPVAEPMDRRPGTKGNGVPQSGADQAVVALKAL